MPMKIAGDIPSDKGFFLDFIGGGVHAFSSFRVSKSI
jgi:hypothetical protein